jgi:hypothetical protein
VLTAEEARLWSTVVRKIKPIAESPVESGALVAVDQKRLFNRPGKRNP